MSADARTVVVRCPSCETRLRYRPSDPDALRSRVRCTSCETVFAVRLKPRRDLRDEIPTPDTPGAPDASSMPQARSVAGPGPDVGAGAASGAAASTGGLLTPGEVLAGRYEIVRWISRGGMGEVYEAEDRELGGRLAVKTIRPDVAAETASLERFKREIQLARRVTHPNVCRIFDVFRHRRPNGHELVFLTMELLAGESLDRRLARDGALTPEAALPLVRQLADALDAAHRAGVVHRDFKAANVMLVTRGPGDDAATLGGDAEVPPRAVVTDFGLARPALDPGLTQGLTLPGTALGTPAYMSPEQVQGHEITGATDVYAFGLTVYEMLTGRLPFEGDSPLTVAVRRLQEAPTPPRQLVPDLPPEWERLILGCLERDPADRFATAGDAVAVVTGGDEMVRTTAGPAETTPVPAPERRSWKEKLTIAALLLVIVGSVAVGVIRVLRVQEPDDTVRQVLGLPAGEVEFRETVAVLDLVDLNSEDGWISTVLQKALGAELAAVGGVRVLEEETVRRIERELALGETRDSLDPDQLATLRRASGADYVVVGSTARLGRGGDSNLRLDLALVDTVRGETVASFGDDGPERQLSAMAAAAAEVFADALGMSAAGTATGLPVTPEAARLYGEGLAAMEAYEPRSAVGSLGRAAELEPSNPLIQSALSSAWSNLGDETRARQAAARARELADGLAPEEKLRIDARFFESRGEWDRAADTWRGLWAESPDDVEAGLRLVAASLRAGDAPVALAAVAFLQGLGPPEGDDPRIDLAEARVAGATGDTERQLRSAAQAAEEAEIRGTGLLLAQARLLECEAERSLSNFDRAEAACEESRRLSAERDDPTGEASALGGLASIARDRGEPDTARDLFGRALEIYQRIGNQGAVAAVSNNLAVVLRGQGELDRARELYEGVIASSREVGNTRGIAAGSTNLAALLVQQGELARARELLEEALDLRRDLGDRPGEGATLDLLGVATRLAGDPVAAEELHGQAVALARDLQHPRDEAVAVKNRAWALYDAGRPEDARQGFSEALELARTRGFRDLEAAALEGLGEVTRQAGDLPAARQRLARAETLYRELGRIDGRVRARLALTRLAVDAERPAAALAFARQTVRALEAGGEERGERDDRIAALALLARAQRRAGREGAARESAGQAVRWAESSENLGLVLAAGIEAAAVDPAGAAAAGARLEQLARRAAEANLSGLAFEARLAAVEAGAVGPGEATTLTGEAAAAGYPLIARLADRSRG